MAMKLPRRKAPPIRFRGRVIESRTQKFLVFVARLVVGLAGLLFFLLALMVIKAGIGDHSLSLAAVGSLLALSALILVWAGFTSNGRDVCEAALIFLISR
jgi:hypothetical protein